MRNPKKIYIIRQCYVPDVDCRPRADGITGQIVDDKRKCRVERTVAPNAFTCSVAAECVNRCTTDAASLLIAVK